MHILILYTETEYLKPKIIGIVHEHTDTHMLLNAEPHTDPKQMFHMT